MRIPMSVRAQTTSRTVDQWLAVRFPGLAARLFGWVLRLRPESRLRQAFLSRGVRLGLEAYNRRDLDAASATMRPSLEYVPYREFVEAGLAEPVYRGPEGYRSYIEGTYDVWGAGVRLEPTELIDLGDRLVVLADMPMRAQGSGVALSETYGSVWTLGDGGIVRIEDFLDHDEALRAAGVSP